MKTAYNDIAQTRTSYLFLKFAATCQGQQPVFCIKIAEAVDSTKEE